MYKQSNCFNSPLESKESTNLQEDFQAVEDVLMFFIIEGILNSTTIYNYQELPIRTLGAAMKKARIDLGNLLIFIFFLGHLSFEGLDAVSSKLRSAVLVIGFSFICYFVMHSPGISYCLDFCFKALLNLLILIQ